MDIKLFDSELKVMNVIWDEGICSARHVAEILKGRYGWNINTTYTLIKRCIKKERLNVPSRTSCAVR